MIKHNQQKNAAEKAVRTAKRIGIFQWICRFLSISACVAVFAHFIFTRDCSTDATLLLGVIAIVLIYLFCIVDRIAEGIKERKFYLSVIEQVESERLDEKNADRENGTEKEQNNE